MGKGLKIKFPLASIEYRNTETLFGRTRVQEDTKLNKTAHSVYIKAHSVYIEVEIVHFFYPSFQKNP